MIIYINGKAETCDDNINIYDLIVNLKLNPEQVVAELNEDIVLSESYKNTILKSDDRIELLQFVGGG